MDDVGFELLEELVLTLDNGQFLLRYQQDIVDRATDYLIEKGIWDA